MPLIRKNPQEIEVKLFFCEKKMPNGFYKTIILTDKEAEDLQKKKMANPKAEVPDVECLTTKWRNLNWETQNEITDRASAFDDLTRTSNFNYFKYRDLRLKRCLISWDLKDEDGKPVLLNEMSINAMPSDAVLALINKYDDIVVLKDEDRKN